MKAGFVSFAALALVACGSSTPTPSPPQAAPLAPPLDTSRDDSPAPPPTPITSAPTPKVQLADLEKAAIKSFVAAFNAHDLKSIQALYADGCVLASYNANGLEELKGHDGVAQSMGPDFAAFPDVAIYPTRVFQKGDVVVMEYVGLGTNTGPFMGAAPTKKKVGVRAMDILWFNADGLITRDESFGDFATLLQQLGKMHGKARAIPAKPSAEPTWVVANGTPEEDKVVEQMKATWPATWTAHDAKAYEAAVSDDGIHIEIASPNDYKGKAALMKEYATYAKAIPDMKVSIDKAWGFGADVVVAEFTFSGTMQGDLGPFKATKKPLVIHGADVDVIKNGKLNEGITYSNGMELLAQLGVLPKPKPPAAAAPPAKVDAAKPATPPAKTAPATPAPVKPAPVKPAPKPAPAATPAPKK